MRKILATILALSMLFCLAAAFAFNADAASEMLMIYETEEDIVIDGELDEGYFLISSSKTNEDGNWVPDELSTYNNETDFYGCWKGPDLFLYIKVPCNEEEHVAWMDNAAEHYIFNAHHVMWALLPDNPYQDKYKGDNDDGTWSWGALYNANFMYEWSTICDSREDHLGESVIADHFRTISTTEGFEFKCTANGVYDCYEVRIPMEKCVSDYSPKGIEPKVGSMFGIGFSVGLADTGTGYSDEETDPDTYHEGIDYSDYFAANKNPYGLAYAKLVSTLDVPDEPTVIESKYEVFPAAAGEWLYTDHNDTRCNVTVKNAIATISGSTSGTWPCAFVNYLPKLLVDPETTYLVYDIKVEGGLASFRFNQDEQVNTFITTNTDSGSNDMQAGEYKGYISFADIAAAYPENVNEDGLYEISNFTVYSVGGAVSTVNLFNIVPNYEIPSESSEPASEAESPAAEESSEAPVESSEPIAESSAAPEASEPAAESSVAVESSEAPTETPDGGFQIWVWIVIGVVVVGIIVAVVIVINKKKQQF